MNKIFFRTLAVLCCTLSVLNAEVPIQACIEWNAPWPKADQPDAGLGLLPDTEHYTVFAGSRELGMFNHGPIIESFNGKLFVTWFSHDKYEGAAGTRTALFFFRRSADLVQTDCRAGLHRPHGGQRRAGQQSLRNFHGDSRTSVCGRRSQKYL